MAAIVTRRLGGRSGGGHKSERGNPYKIYLFHGMSISGEYLNPGADAQRSVYGMKSAVSFSFFNYYLVGCSCSSGVKYTDQLF